jgi:hypothetical protein
MKLEAEKVLEDCKLAQARLAKAESEGNWDEIRLNWILCVCLLRMVGHVLKEVDVKRSEDFKKVILKKWKEVESEKEFEKDVGYHVFKIFIKPERDDVLKEYNIGISYVPMMFDEDQKPVEFALEYTKSALIRGASPQFLVSDAVLFWDRHISDIKKRAIRND